MFSTTVILKPVAIGQILLFPVQVASAKNSISLPPLCLRTSWQKPDGDPAATTVGDNKTMKKRLTVIAICVSLLAFSSSALNQTHATKSTQVATYFVGRNGDDSSGAIAQPNPDRTDGPFATLHAARNAARKLGTERPRKIVVQAGQYFLNKPLVLTAEDSGLTIEPASGAKVCLYGGKRITGWKKDGERFYSVILPGMEDRSWD
jgi:hypothetical protein